MDWLQLILALCLGVALAAMCGFRVFVPALVAALAARFGALPLNDSFSWLQSDATIICLSVASVVELLAYYIPWVDHALDSVSSPLALVAGTLLTVGLLPEMPGFAQWGLGIVAGAGAAGSVQAGTVAVRSASSATTGGMGNFVVTTAENGASIVGSLIAVFVSPFIVLVCLALFMWLIWRVIRRFRRAKRSASA